MLRSYAWVGDQPLPSRGQEGSSASAGAAPTVPPVVLYVGYYRSQRTGATYHSPQHCLPGAGWQITELRRVALPGPGGSNVTVNEVIVQKGLSRQLMLYWYQDRGRVVASEYWAKAYMVWDSLTKNRSDGALVRVSVQVERDLAPAREQVNRFIVDMWRPLTDALPGAVPREVATSPATALAAVRERRAR
jgi:EpsI family protein